MAQTVGIVTKTREDGHATVMAEKEKGWGCGRCISLAHCHLGRAGGAEETTAINQAEARVGDRVALKVDSGSLLSRMAVLYLVPVAGMLVGAFTGAIGGNGSDGRGIVFGLLGFLIGFGISVSVSRVWATRRPIQPVITRIIPYGLGAPRSVSGCGDGRN